MIDTKYKAIEENIIDAVREPCEKIGVLTIKSYAGELSEDSIAERTLRSPAVLVNVDKMSVETMNLRSNLAFDIKIYAVDSNARGKVAQKSGDVVSPGVYAIFETIRKSLHGTTLSIGNAPLLSSEELSLYSKNMSMCIGTAFYSINLPVNIV